MLVSDQLKENKHTEGQHQFFNHQAQTTPYANGMEISHAKGMYIYDIHQNKYLDLVAGVSACTLGHGHPQVTKSITNQLEKYAHVMVYGEYVQSPQYQLSKQLIDHLHPQLNCTYLVNSGAEAIEGAMKLAKRISGRNKLFRSTTVIMVVHTGHCIMGKELYKSKYRPLLPNCHLLDYGNFEQVETIDQNVAAVVVEPIQGATGFPPKDWLLAIRQRCDDSETLLIFDEIQTGFGRTGKLFALDTLGCSTFYA